MIGRDVKYELDGRNSLLNVNHLFIAMQLKSRYREMVRALGDLKNPLYEAARRSPVTGQANRDELLVRLALRRDDEECLRTMADVLERNPLILLTYWERSLVTRPTSFAEGCAVIGCTSIT